MLNFVCWFFAVWFIIGFVCSLGWSIATFKWKFFTVELRYRLPITWWYFSVGILLGPFAFIYGAYGHALHNSD
jgi:hypothetical protein